MKKWIIISLIILIAIIGIITGILLFKNNDTSEYKVKTHEKLASENDVNLNIQIIKTSGSEEKVSPNALVIYQKYYEKCNHTVTEKQNTTEQTVNKTEKEIKDIFKNWELKKFSSQEIILYKEEEGICKEHYVLREKDGFIAIYTIDENDKETLKQITDIVTNYLPETDIYELEKGIKLIGNEQLNSTLEDYE